MTSYIQACGRVVRSGKDVATIRTTILERDTSVFTQYQRWHMVHRQEDDDETGLAIGSGQDTHHLSQHLPTSPKFPPLLQSHVKNIKVVLHQ